MEKLADMAVGDSWATHIPGAGGACPSCRSRGRA